MFQRRHIGPDADELSAMLASIGIESVGELIDRTVPDQIRDEALELAPALSEHEATERLRSIAARNQVYTSLIGAGYHATITPPVIRRNILENPAWYTAYTPYQPEISQGRLEALLNYQTMIADLCGLEIANASLLDEATAAAEAMVMLLRLSRTDRTVFVVDAAVHPQTLAVVRSRAEPIGIEVRVADRADPVEPDVFGVLYQYPGTSGEVYDLQPLIAQVHDVGALAAVAADPLALVLLRSPGECGADVVVGSSQRFGVPMGCGGPHAGFVAAREGSQRSLPGRVVGLSVDAEGRPALRLALQTREQHIRRDKATSNICTAQVLLAVVAAMYASYHGPDGLRAIADRVHSSTTRLAGALRAAGFDLAHERWFDTLTVVAEGRASAIAAAASAHRINLRLLDEDRVSIALDETTDDAVLQRVLASFGVETALDGPDAVASPLNGFEREDAILQYEPFSRFHTETEMLRYLRRLADKDLALDRTMIPLGSCTMKLNATSEMEPISWPEFADIHPFAPADQRQGYTELVAELEAMLSEITGYAGVSIQPNAGSQGELAGLLAIRAFHRDNGHEARDVCLIPSSAHGTNAASAVMAGMRVVVVACNDAGDVDVDDLGAQIDQHRDRLAALMVTYPSTHGVFEDAITQVCEMVHEAGGQVYLDGANLNALVGLARPGRFGADVSHLNLHKTFCIPHGGGGPGVGPVAVADHLVPYLPAHPELDVPRNERAPVISAAPWGSAGILPIPWMYIAMMGPDGLRAATQMAIVSANYVAARLEPYFPVLYRGRNGHVAHECIIDLRPVRERSGITVDDVAKRLIDYGFHAPTMSFPVAGTLMIEPTESESKAELDRFCDAMIAIAGEIARVEAGEWPADDNPLVHAPHTAECVAANEWSRAYPRETGAFPTSDTRRHKVFAPVARIDGAYGDRNFVCSCPPIEELAELTASP